MIVSSKIRIIFKVISCLMAGIFLFQQIAWAGDLIETVLTQQAQAQAQTFAPEYLQSQTATAEDLVTMKQSVEDTIAAQSQAASVDETETEDASITLQGASGGSAASETSDSVATIDVSSATSDTSSSEDIPIMSVTTEEGDEIKYKNSVIYEITKKDGTVLSNIVLDADNNLVAADILYVDGTKEVVADGKVKTITSPEGIVYNYNSDELMESVVYADGSITAYSYIKDDDGNIVEIMLTDLDKTVYYDAAGRLKKVIKSDDTVINYQDGMLSSIEKADGSIYVFNKETISNEDGEDEFVITLGQYKDKDGNYFEYSNGEFIGAQEDSDIQMSDGTTRIIREGCLIRVRKVDGSVLGYERDISGNITSIILTLPDNTSYCYTPEGELFKKIDPSGAIYYSYEDG
ncbi:MAG: hypothetical protein WCY36_06810, partial [Candidatus Omnitrophota bacterium]